MSKNLLQDWLQGNLDDVDTFEPIQKKQPKDDEWIRQMADDPRPPEKREQG